jgi:flavodoxin I
MQDQVFWSNARILYTILRAFPSPDFARNVSMNLPVFTKAQAKKATPGSTTLHIIYASTSGHTEFVIDTLSERIASRRVAITKQRAEQAAPADLLKGDILLLASGTWNTGGIEGQLNPYMHMLLKEKAAGIDLKGKKVVIIGLGDDRYRYTANALHHLEEFVKTHNGVVLDHLKMVNEPYNQEKTVEQWGKKLLSKLTTA